MAGLVDRQNCGRCAVTGRWRPAFDGPAFQAASDLVFKGAVQPNGYTEADAATTGAGRRSGGKLRPDAAREVRMRILVVGAGSTGGYFGGRLASGRA